MCVYLFFLPFSLALWHHVGRWWERTNDGNSNGQFERTRSEENRHRLLSCYVNEMEPLAVVVALPAVIN